ncbi:hypothetical protein [Streptomyces sp. NPDC091299]|uniref:hypothetical protein n=1 Tax=Streptomyces sp. NPDC091299 TaxID=3155302 RepID=UPI0034397A61
MTSPGCHGTPLDPHSGALANEVEGYLLLEAEREQAQREADALCARLPWLTSGQAEDLARHYTEQRLGLTRQALQATADRAGRLRGEYEARYATLRHALLRRHAVGACLLIVGCTTATAGASLFVR